MALLFRWLILILIHVLLYEPLLYRIGFNDKLVWPYVTHNALRIPAVAQLSLLLIWVFSFLLLFLAVNVEILLSESLFNLYRSTRGWFLNLGIANHRIFGTITIITHFSVEMTGVSNLNDLLFILNFLNTGLDLDTLIDVFNLVENLGWNLITTVEYFERLVFYTCIR